MSTDILRVLFNRESMIRRLQALPAYPTVVMDEVFTSRPQIASATVPVEDVAQVVRTMPLIQRGGASISMGNSGSSISSYEPLPISPHTFVSAADVNTLRGYDSQGLEAWATQRTNVLRQTVRRTTEGMAAQAINGTIEWPIQLTGGGTDVYTVKWGKPVAVIPKLKLDAATATLETVVTILSDMRKALRRKGYAGGAVKVWAGEDAYSAILKLAARYEGHTIEAKVQEDCILLGSTKIVLRNEEYPDPMKKDTWVPIQNKTTLRMIDPAGGHQMPYCALDDFDAKLAPLPLFIKPIKTDDPSGYKLVAQSKPFPVPNMEAISEAIVV